MLTRSHLGKCAVIPLEEYRRTSRRRVVSLSAYAREVNTALLEVEISNLSTDGCRLKCARALEPETAVWLGIAGITPRRAVIRWSRDCEAGCAFDSPIPAAVVAELTAGAEHTARRLRKSLQGRRA